MSRAEVVQEALRGKAAWRASHVGPTFVFSFPSATNHSDNKNDNKQRLWKQIRSFCDATCWVTTSAPCRRPKHFARLVIVEKLTGLIRPIIGLAGAQLDQAVGCGLGWELGALVPFGWRTFPELPFACLLAQAM